MFGAITGIYAYCLQRFTSHLAKRFQILHTMSWIWYLCLTLFPASAAFKWTSTIGNGTTIYACENDAVAIPWDFSIDNQEELVSIKWSLDTSENGKRRSLALKTQTGLKSNVPQDQMKFNSNAQLQILQLNKPFFGNYTTKVTVNRAGVTSEYSQTVTIALPEPPVSFINQLQVLELPNPVFQEDTGQFLIQLAFGVFADLGKPPATALWTTPTGLNMASTGYENGVFYFNIPRPAYRGVYSSQLQIANETQRCTPTSPDLKQKYTVSVNTHDIKENYWQLLEDRLEEEETKLEKQDVRLQEEVVKLEKQENKILQMEAQLRRLKSLHADEVHWPASCADVRSYDTTSGIHTLYFPGNISIRVRCDQTTDSTGWTVFLRRLDGTVDFYRPWDDYEYGFGDLQGEFWLGLNNLHLLTNIQSQILRVDLTDFDGMTSYALYNEFYVSNYTDYYRLLVGDYSGTAGDSLTYHNDSRFSSDDKDNDRNPENCALHWKSPWWFNNCHNTLPTGHYKPDGSIGMDGVVWYNWKNDWRSYKRLEMKITPKLN